LDHNSDDGSWLKGLWHDVAIGWQNHWTTPTSVGTFTYTLKVVLDTITVNVPSCICCVFRRFIHTKNTLCY
jgi:hypothetical protein